jgi:ABC-2 type transport system permease protein
MLSALSAETLKLRRHRGTWMLVWIFPIGTLIISAIAILAQMARSDGPPERAMDLQRWLENAADFWDAPPSGIVRFLICAFVALAFAGEYGWNTWKLIVPHRARSTLIAAKYLVSTGLLYTAFIIAALIFMASGYVEDVVTGDPIPEGITFGGLAAAHWQGFLGSLPPVLLTIAIASAAAILTRSTTAGLIIGIVIVTLEQLFRSFGPLLSMYLPGITEALYQALPGYHVANLTEWATDGQALSVPFPNGSPVEYGWEASLAITAIWIAGLVALTFWSFRRQDIN